MHSAINSTRYSDLLKSFSNGVLDILYQCATFNDVEACKDALRGHIRPYLFYYSVNQLDTALKEIRQQLIEQKPNQPDKANAYWNEMILDVHDSLFQEEMLYKNINSYNLFLVNYESLAKYQNALSNNEKLSPFFWRVTKNELIVPQENEDVVLKIVANNVEQQLINLMWKKFSQSPFKLYIRLIQLASNPQLLKERISLDMYGDFSSDIEDLSINFIDEKPIFDENEIKLIDSIVNSSKYIECINQAVKLTQESKIIIIWCIFIDTIKKLSDDLSDKGLRVAVIHGGIDNKERENIILDFQNGLYDVLVTNPHTLAESVSLHMIAHDAIYLEYSFNLTHMLQSRDRFHRLGLKENQETNYFYFMLEGQDGQRSTIDQKIYYKLLSKRDIMYEAIESPMVAPQFSINEKDEILEMMLEELDQKNI